VKIECAFNKQKQKKRQNTTQNLSTTYYFSYLDPISGSLQKPVGGLPVKTIGASPYWRRKLPIACSRLCTAKKPAV